MSLFVFIGITVVVAVCIQVLVIKSKRRQKTAIDQDWKKFQNAVERKDIGEIHSYGEKLIWNVHLNQKQLNIMLTVVDQHVTRHTNLQELRLNILNKQLQFKRTMPEAWSSGGTEHKQSW